MKKKKKKKLALGVTAAAIVASAIPVQSVPAFAAENEQAEVVYTSFNSGGSNSAHTGNGTEGSP